MHVKKMRTISIIVEDIEFLKLEEQKGTKTWRDFFLSIAEEVRNK